LPTSWGGYWSEIDRLARALLARGVEKGDTTCVLSFNRPEWTIADLATMAIGGVPAGIYTTNSPKEVQYIAHHCEARFMFVENIDQWKKVDEVRDELPNLEAVIIMEGGEAVEDDLAIAWDKFIAEGDEVDSSEVSTAMDAIEEEDTATLIYTSGTTGPPKAVMLTHQNLSFTASVAKQIVSADATDRLLSYLPLSHIAEQMFTIHGSSTIGYSIYYAESIDDLPDNLKEVKPTVFFGVPRIWEKFHAGINHQLQQATGIKATMANWARNVGSKVSRLRCKGEEPTGLLKMQYGIAKKLVFTKLREAVGLSEARICVSGAAPLSEDVMNFFLSLDIIVHEVYGQSEDCGPTTFNLPGNTRIGSVGTPIPGVDVRIADDGEVMVKGGNVFKGYYKNQEATDETLTDGWLHSGDLGEFRDGFLYIIGRKKEIIITAGGKNIAPKNIEAALKRHDLINEAVVIGDRRKYLSALVTLDEDAAPEWAEKHGVDVSTLHENEELNAEIQKHVDEINKEFARVETVKKFKVLERNFTVDDGELTPTLKIKRRIIDDHFADEIESMYE
jgi:long-chain acyl-CoA synthetase